MESNSTIQIEGQTDTIPSNECQTDSQEGKIDTNIKAKMISLNILNVFIIITQGFLVHVITSLCVPDFHNFPSMNPGSKSDQRASYVWIFWFKTFLVIGLWLSILVSLVYLLICHFVRRYAKPSEKMVTNYITLAICGPMAIPFMMACGMIVVFVEAGTADTDFFLFFYYVTVIFTTMFIIMFCPILSLPSMVLSYYISTVGMYSNIQIPLLDQYFNDMENPGEKLKG
ncbi:MAG: hypothetical protein Edafosvirus1_66 [Edafosvirus sp.]|uniref:Transmembrane protein n=1 Tax=Edafosvirus sp. TaxID=2487765 RepID=A0A3G4ZS74_9VIRU|nr:MAG: hypothetical protein Edafosvirus1_66 [Edafosvirus sp.]